MTHRVVITPTAVTDIAGQIAYLSDASHDAALRWYNGCLDAIQSLGTMPRRCALAPEAAAFEREIRQRLFDSHRILFEVAADTVYILHVRHGARLPLTPDVETHDFEGAGEE